MPSIDCLDEIEIDAPAQRVFDVISDYPNWSTWLPVYHCEYIGEAGLREGARLHHRYGRKPFVMSEFVRSIDRIVPGERLEESYVEGDLIGKGTWEFVEVDGRTRASYHCRVRSNRPGSHLALALAGGFGHSAVYKSLLKKLKARCEA